MKKKTVVMMALFFLLTGVGASYGQIVLQPDFTGTVMITSPQGEIQMVSQGERIPEIVAGSTLEVLEGELHVSSAKSEVISLACIGNRISAVSADVTLQCAEQGGLLKVLKGSAQVTDPDNVLSDVKEGEEKVLVRGNIKGAKKAEPTAAGEETGLPISTSSLGTPPPADSRNIESSQSQ